MAARGFQLVVIKGGKISYYTQRRMSRSMVKQSLTCCKESFHIYSPGQCRRQIAKNACNINQSRDTKNQSFDQL